MRGKWRWTAGLIVMEVALLGGLIYLMSINRTEWIIRMGILRTDRVIRVIWVLWATLAALLNLIMLVVWLRRRRRKAAAQVKLTMAPDASQQPDAIRRELERFISLRPQLKPSLEQGLDQLDNIARKKEKMNEILDRNEVSILRQASDALDGAEQTLCRKLVLVLNRALLCDPEEENARRKQAVYEQHSQYIQAFLAENEEVLNRCEKLLAETVRYVEEKKAGRDEMDVKIMTDVIRSLYDGGIQMK